MSRAVIVSCILMARVLAAPCISTSMPQNLNPDYVAFQIKQLGPDMRHEFGGLQYLLDSNELDEFLSLKYDHARRRWIEDFWKAKDPVFTTAENEIRTEHNRRVAYAESLFFIPKWPMWDQRGEVYIRYGAPDSRQIIAREVTQAGFVPPRELWFYRTYNMYVLFEDAFGNGEYTYYLEKVRGPSGIRMNRIGQSIDALGGEIPVVPSIAAEAEQEKLLKMIHRFTEVLQTAPASYKYNLKQNKLPFFFSVDNFRGGIVNRVDVNIEFPADLSGTTYGSKFKRYVATTVFWDTDQKEVERREQHLEIPTTRVVPDSFRLMPAQLTVSLPPGFYLVAVTVEESNSGKVSSYRTNFICKDFENKLAVSDILFASKITATTRTSPFNRGPLEVVPHPSRRYRRSAAVPVYFEVYNLQVDGRGLSSYTVEYRIISQTPKKLGFWDSILGRKHSLDVSSRFHASGPGPSDHVHITIGSDNLWEGKFALQVKITDDISLAEITKEKVFSVLE
jgi:GWxTD domain-containing protein